MKEGDYIVRTWPSGTKTMGIVHRIGQSLFFKSLETYPYEGGVIIDGLYGGIIDGKYDKYRHTAATKQEVKIFNKIRTLVNAEVNYRDIVIEEILSQ